MSLFDKESEMSSSKSKTAGFPILGILGLIFVIT
jgi:hypothetical protein